MSKTNRRQFLKAGGAAVGAVALLPRSALRAAATPASFVSAPPRMKVGLVTYELAKSWNIETIIKNCGATGFQGVELRTTHAHKVEVNLSTADRAAVKSRFADSKVQLMGLGSVFDFHTPDQAKLRRDIEAAKEYIVLAQDVGATGVKVRPNGIPKNVPKEKTIEQIGRSLHELGDFARDHGQVIRLEVHPGGAESALLPNVRKMMDFADHPSVGVCWNSNQSDLGGDGFDANFDLVKDKIFSVHMRDLYLDEYPFRKLVTRLNETGFHGFCLAEIPESADPLRVMRYFRSLWLAYQNLL